tara:strand:- start:5526 stop:6389 length:864 start_codon:yes stop_codon:yes gene_type:complete
MDKFGDINSFNKNWKNREEANYSHWTRNKPINQIQLAFREHWKLFKKIIIDNSKNLKIKKTEKKILEVGCGRGTLSAYFSDNGYKNVYLLDKSKKVIQLAKNFFLKNKLKGKFIISDCIEMPFKENYFDLVFSIGLFEHFTNPKLAIKEQIRVLKKKGIIILYIVPQKKNKIQDKYGWINNLLTHYNKKKNNNSINKEKVFRSNFGIEYYKKILKTFDLKKIEAHGIYPVPMISHSIDFPFSLMPIKSEKNFLKVIHTFLKKNNHKYSNWLCKEDEGQAIILWGIKK